MKERFTEITLYSLDEALNEYRYLCSQFEDVRMEQFIIMGTVIYGIKYRYERD